MNISNKDSYLLRRDQEFNKEELNLIKSLPVDEQGLFMSPFLVKNGYIYIPETTLREFQDMILKYLGEIKKRSVSIKDENSIM